MDRRHFLALLSTPAVAALLNACGSDDATPGTDGTPGTDPPTSDPPTTTGPITTAAPSDPTTTPSTNGPTTGEARSGLTRVTAGAEEAPPAARASNEFGHALYRVVADADATGNLVVSPASIALALSMTAAGARGETLEQMVRALQIDDADGMHRAANALSAELEARNSAGVELSIANSLWAQIGLSFEQEFLDLLATEYGAGLNLVDYRADPEAARVAINEWVEEATRERIPDLLAEGIITPDSRLTLVNAIYMKAPWQRQFDEAVTSDLAFTTAAGSSVTVPAMHMSRSMLHASGDGWQAVELPYEGDAVTMLLLVPDAGELADVEATLSMPSVAEALAPRPVRLALPRFDIESSLALGDTLEGLGMELAFTDDADFSGMTEQQALMIAAVVHQANITVDEFGTEAAASTAVVMEPTSAPADEPVELTIDRPFLFAVRDRGTGVILFLGRVGDPVA